MLSFRGLGKGYRFFKDGHVQAIEYHALPQTPGLCLVQAKVLPSMVSKIYTVKVKVTFIRLGFSLMVKYTLPIVFALLDLLAPATILQGCFMPWKSLSDLDYEKNQSFHARASYRCGTGQGEECHQAVL